MYHHCFVAKWLIHVSKGINHYHRERAEWYERPYQHKDGINAANQENLMLENQWPFYPGQKMFFNVCFLNFSAVVAVGSQFSVERQFIFILKQRGRSVALSRGRGSKQSFISYFSSVHVRCCFEANVVLLRERQGRPVRLSKISLSGLKQGAETALFTVIMIGSQRIIVFILSDSVF